jgi:hypothetical protein
LSWVNPHLPTRERRGARQQEARAGWSQELALAALLGSFLFAMTLFAYCRTLQPTVGDFGDSAKFQVVANVLGIPHATGYPLYVPLAKLFTLLPIRDAAFRVNLLSAVSAAAAVALLSLAIWGLTHNLLASAGASLLFAWSRTFWSQAVIAEVYTLNAAFLALVIVLLFLWQKRGGQRLYVGVLAAYAFSLGNHASMILLIPGLLWFIGTTDRKKLTQPRNLALTAGVLALGACQYLFLFLRARQHPSYCETCPDTLPKLWWYLTGAQFRSRFFALSWQELGNRLIHYWNFLVAEYGLFPISVGLLGIVTLGTSKWRESGLLVLAFAANLLFTLSYDIADFMFFLIPTYLIFAVWIGGGLAVITRWVAYAWRRMLHPAYGLVASGGWTLVLVGLTLWPLWANYDIVDESNNYAPREEATAILNLMADDAILVLPPCCDFYNRTMGILYLQQVEGIKSGIAITEFSAAETNLITCPPFLPREEMTTLLAKNGERVRSAYVPHVSPDVVSSLEKHFVLRPVDSSTLTLAGLLDELPPGSIVVIGSRHPASFAVDQSDTQQGVQTAMRGLGFAEVRWPGAGAHILIGVRGAEPGTAVEIQHPALAQARFKKGQPIGTTGIKTPVPILVLASAGDTDIVVDGKNVSPHHRYYNLVVLAPESGDVVLAAHFDTDTFLVNNTRVYQITAVKLGAASHADTHDE